MKKKKLKNLLLLSNFYSLFKKRLKLLVFRNEILIFVAEIINCTQRWMV
jgi:hypothetical protein